jgi:hypothetical protein
MSISRSAAFTSSVVTLAAIAGCSDSLHYGVSSGGSSWNTASESTIPGLDFGTARITTLICGAEAGVTVVVWSDLDESSRQSSDSTEERAFEQVALTGKAGSKVEYTVETTDGETATIKLQGAEFSSTAGNLFLVSTHGGKPRIAQINVNIHEFPNEPAEIKAFAADHEEIEKFFKAALPEVKGEGEDEE